MTALRKPVFSVAEVRSVFSYDPETGFLSRGDTLLDGKSMRASYRGYAFIKTQLIWAIHYGYWSDKLIDHWDGDNTNNKLENLREATYQQNQFNKVGFGEYPKGVVFKRDANRSKPWAARIRIDGKKIPIGSYYTMEEAAAAYVEAAEKYQGEFAFHNTK